MREDAAFEFASEIASAEAPRDSLSSPEPTPAATA